MRRSLAPLWVLLQLPLLGLGCGANDARVGSAADSANAAAEPTPTPAVTPPGAGMRASSVAQVTAPPVPEPRVANVADVPSVPDVPGAPGVPDIANLDMIAPPVRGKSEGDISRPLEPVLLSSVQVLEVLGNVLAGGDPPSDIMWRSRAAQACDRDPKLSEHIVDRILADATSSAGREFGAELLASHPNSQAALRRLLNDPQVRADPQYYAVLSKLLFLVKPEDATVDLALSLRGSEDFMLHSIATAVLGHQIATHLSGGRKDAGVKLANKLKAIFRKETDLAERAMLLTAIGAGGLPETLPFVRSFVRDKEPKIREAAAKGLNLDNSKKGGQLLLRLAVDPDPDVQAAAIGSLHYHPLTTTQQKTFHSAIMSDQVRPPNDGVLVHVIDKRLIDPDRKHALNHLLKRNPDNFVTGHINNVLAR